MLLRVAKQTTRPRLILVCEEQRDQCFFRKFCLLSNRELKKKKGIGLNFGGFEEKQDGL